MHIATTLCAALLAIASAGCLDSEQTLPLAIAGAEDAVASGELLGEQPELDPQRPPELGDCGVLVGDEPDLFVVGDYQVTTQADADALADKRAVTGRLVIDADAGVDLTPLSSVRCIAGDLRVGGAGVKSLEGLHALEYVGGHLMIEDASALRDLGGLRAVCFVRGELRVHSAAQLVDLSGLDELGVVGHLVLADNERLVSLAGVEALADVNGSVLIYRNPVLGDVDGLAAVEWVGGDIRVVDNPALPRCAVEQWAAPLTPNGDAGEAEIVGNDDTVSCAP